MLARWTGWVCGRVKTIFTFWSPPSTSEMPFCRAPLLRADSEKMSLKRWVRQAKLFRGDLIADSYSAVGQLFFSLSLPSPDVSCLSMTQLSICCLWSGLDHRIALLMWQLSGVPFWALFDRFHCPFDLGLFFACCLSYRASRSLCVFLGCPSLLEPTVAEWQREISRGTLPLQAPPKPLWLRLQGGTPRYAIGPASQRSCPVFSCTSNTPIISICTAHGGQEDRKRLLPPLSCPFTMQPVAGREKNDYPRPTSLLEGWKENENLFNQALSFI